MKAARKRQRRCRRKTHRIKRSKRPNPKRTLRQAILTFLPARIFSGTALHGNSDWTLFALSFVAVFWGWASETTLGDRLYTARQAAGPWLPDAFVATSYPGFIDALVSHNARLVGLASGQLRAMMQRIAGSHWTVADFVAFGVDGTKNEAPWTAANEKQLGKKGRKPKGAKCRRNETDLRPQLTLTLIWHLGLELPWAWKQGGLANGERSQFRDMLELLPKAALIVADAGFVGYELWCTIIRSGRHFLVRVGSNIELLVNLFPGSEIEHSGDIVYLWPKGKQKQGEPSLQLRLITLRGKKQTVYLVTSVLDATRLTDEQASLLYSKRWTIECGFRGLKHTLERRKVRSHTPRHAACELDWSLLSLWLLSLVAKQQLIESDQPPATMSLSQSLRLLRRAFRERTFGVDFDVRLFQSAVKDQYKRQSSKKARHDPRKKRDKPPRPPKINAATATQQQAVKGRPPLVAVTI